MKTSTMNGIRSFLVFALLFPAFGCGATKSVVSGTVSAVKGTVSVVGKINPWGDSGLKKRVLVLGFRNMSKMNDSVAAAATSEMIERLNKYDQLVLYKKPQGNTWPEVDPANITGNKEIMENAESLGIHSILSGSVNSIDITTKKGGIWPFRKTKQQYEISVFVHMVDVMAKTVLLTMTKSDTTTVSMDDSEDMATEEFYSRFIEDALPDIIKKTASNVADRLKELPWRGKIAEIDNENIKILAGKDVGVRADQRFAVYSKSEPVQAYNGQTYYILGDRVGEIRTSEVMEEHAIAKAGSEGPYEVGQVIEFLK